MQGTIQVALGLRSFLSNFIAGFITKNIRFNAAFLFLAAVAAIGFGFYAIWMPETKGSTVDDENDHPAIPARQQLFQS